MNNTQAGGPKTAAGKARSAQNARRHGLACCAALDPSLAPQIERLAQDFAGPGADPVRLFYARRVAEADVDLRRIRLARRDLLQRPVPSPGLPPARALIFLNRRLQGGDPPDEFTLGILRRIRTRKFQPWDVAAYRLKELAVFERYERRAHSRRRSALREMEATPGPFLAERTPECRQSEVTPAAPAAPRTDAEPAASAPNGSGSQILAERTRAAAHTAPAPTSARGVPDHQWGATLLRHAASRSATTAGPGIGEPRDVTRNLVLQWAWAGASHERIARRLRLSPDELRRDYAPELDCASDIIRAEASLALFTKACEGDVTAAIYLAKTRLGWRESGPRRRAALRKPPPVDVKKQLVDRIMNMLPRGGAIRDGPE